MRIDGPENVGAHGLPDENLPKPPPAKSPDTQAAQPDREVPTGDAAYRQYIVKATATEEIDLQAVTQARELLESGQLDTPEAADRAAENILSTGI